MEFNIADLIEAAADALPEREVLVVGEKRRTNAELDERANRLAHHFLSQGSYGHRPSAQVCAPCRRGEG